MKNIAIIGGGYSGTLTAIHLLKNSNSVSVKLINDGYPLGLGVAFSTNSTEHVLNVPAGKMSAFASHPGHFIDWLKSHEEFKHLVTDNIEQEFIPRYIYGFYLNDIIKEYIAHQQLEIIPAKAIDVHERKELYEVILNNNSSIQASAVVLATGNFLPANPKIKNVSFFDSNNYFQNPWNNSYLNGINLTENILLIGTGLTMVDCLLTLKQINFKGTIYAVSPRGYTPASHTKTSPYADFYDELKDETLAEILKSVRNHIQITVEKNIPWQSVIDAIRPHVQKIWVGLSTKDKQQFVSHLRHIWGVARHRLPQSIYQTIVKLKEQQQLQIIGGRIKNMEDKDGTIYVDIQPRRTNVIQTIQVARVVNCTGPQGNFNDLNDDLIKHLLTKKLIDPDNLKMGIKTLPNGQVLKNEKEISKNMYAVGSLLRGVLWETTSVPDIRVQTESVAKQIINNID